MIGTVRNRDSCGERFGLVRQAPAFLVWQRVGAVFGHDDRRACERFAREHGGQVLPRGRRPAQPVALEEESRKEH